MMVWFGGLLISVNYQEKKKKYALAVLLPCGIKDVNVTQRFKTESGKWRELMADLACTKFKIGDIVRRGQNRVGRIITIYPDKYTEEGGLLEIDKFDDSSNFNSATSNTNWYASLCSLELSGNIPAENEEKDGECKCDILVIMRYGCQCGKR